MRSILVCYRPGDCFDMSERIYQRLRRQFGTDSVSKDFDIFLGGPFDPRSVKAEVARAAILLAVIGPRWITAPGEDEQSWLEDARNHVRIEIESALKHAVPVIPVMLEGASIPAADHLPRSMQKLADRQGLAVRADPDFDHDMGRLIDFIKAEGKTNHGNRVEQQPPVISRSGDAKTALEKRPPAAGWYG